MSGTSPIELATERLRLRAWRQADRAPFAALNAAPEVMEHLLRPLEPEESDAMAERIEAQFRDQGWGLWAVEVVGGPQFIGFVGLNPVDQRFGFAPAVEIGWRLARQHWGLGYASEAARRALDCGFQRLAMSEIVSFTSTTNLRSRRVMERIGMSRDEAGDFDHPRVPEGNPLRRQVLYRLSRPAWLELAEEGRSLGVGS